MAGQGGAPDQGGEKNTYYILWVLALIVFVGAIIWYFADYQLKVFFIALRKYELLAVDFFLNLLPMEHIPFLQSIPARVDADIALVQQITPSNITLDIAEALSVEVGEFLRYPMAAILILLSIYVYRTHLYMRFTKKHSMNTLLQSEFPNWPQIKIVRKLNLLDQDLDSGPWAMAMTPMQFAKKYKLMNVEVAELTGSKFAKTQAPEFKVKLNRQRTERAFQAQLGRSWQGIDNLFPHRQAIFAVLAARGCRDTKLAQELVYQLADSAGDGQLNYKGVDKLIKKHQYNSSVEKICNAHAYEFTVMASMLMFAREDGVLASADFLWVKPMDRRLWYVLNNVGRQTPASEVGGIFCHWYNELALKRPLSVPVVTAAVDALELALSEIIYVPNDKEREEILKKHQDTAAATTTTTMGANPEAGEAV